MKFLLVMIMVAICNLAGAQSLKDALYSGKLKTDSGTVLRKGEDLSSKIDTTRKAPKPEEVKVANVLKDTLQASEIKEAQASASVSQTRDNNKIWKDFAGELEIAIRTEVLPNKKIKEGTYSILIEYEIDVNGGVGPKSVNVSPENTFLSQQVSERITMADLKMTPQIGTNGKPRVAVKKYTLVLTK